MTSDDNARIQYLLQRNLKLVTEICRYGIFKFSPPTTIILIHALGRLRVVNANLQRKNSALSRELLVRSVNSKSKYSSVPIISTAHTRIIINNNVFQSIKVLKRLV